MNDQNRDELERIKLQKEIKKIEAETQSLITSQLRGWLTAFSVIVGITASAFGIVLSSFGVYQTLKEIQLKNKQLIIESQNQAMQAKIRSHEIFLNQVLDRISGIKTEYHELKEEGKEWKMVNVRDDRFGGTTMSGAYAAAVSLANEFPWLRSAAKEALLKQKGTIDCEENEENEKLLVCRSLKKLE